MTPAEPQPRFGGADRPDAALHSLESDGESVSAVLRIGERDHRLAYRVAGGNLARLPSPREISRLPVAGPTTLIFARQNLGEAEARGADPALRRALRRLIWRGDWLLSVKPALTRRWERPVRLISPLVRGVRISGLARRVGE